MQNTTIAAHRHIVSPARWVDLDELKSKSAFQAMLNQSNEGFTRKTRTSKIPLRASYDNLRKLEKYKPEECNSRNCVDVQDLVESDVSVCNESIGDSVSSVSVGNDCIENPLKPFVKAFFPKTDIITKKNPRHTSSCSTASLSSMSTLNSQVEELQNF